MRALHGPSLHDPVSMPPLSMAPLSMASLLAPGNGPAAAHHQGLQINRWTDTAGWCSRSAVTMDHPGRPHNRCNGRPPNRAATTSASRPVHRIGEAILQGVIHTRRQPSILLGDDRWLGIFRGSVNGGSWGDRRYGGLGKSTASMVALARRLANSATNSRRALSCFRERVKSWRSVSPKVP